MRKRPDNPGTFARGTVGVAAGSTQWSESIDAVEALEESLQRAGHAPTAAGDVLCLPGAGLSLLPLVVEGPTPRPEGGFSTTTTVQIGHDALFPAPVFEFQHALGKDVAEALRRGFDEFTRLDLVTILDALAAKPSSMARKFPASDRLPARTRRVVFGPVSGERAAQTASTSATHAPLCPCCMLTRTLGAFDAFLEGNASVAIRFYALRTPDGQSQADCRVNGIPYPAGTAAVRDYVASWTGAGFAFRKQYVVVHTMAS